MKKYLVFQGDKLQILLIKLGKTGFFVTINLFIVIACQKKHNFFSVIFHDLERHNFLGEAKS